MKNKIIWIGGLIGGVIGFILGVWIMILFMINSGILEILKLSNIFYILIPLFFLTFIGYITGYLIQSGKYLWLGILSGAIFGFLSPWIIQFRFVNSIYPIGDLYLKLFGTKFNAGNWHLIFYIPLFMVVWAIVGALIGFIISKVRRKKMKGQK